MSVLMRARNDFDTVDHGVKLFWQLSGSRIKEGWEGAMVNFVPSFYTRPFLFGHSSHFPSYYLHYSKKSVSQDAFKEARHRNEDFQFLLGHSKSE
jgi:hypothetical protein